MEYDQSPETDLGPDRKRRRKVLSCIACRSRKVACDRGLPACGRCSKAGKAAACTYEDDVPSAFNGSSNGSVPQVGGTTRQAQAMVTVSKEVWEDVLSRLLQQESTIERMRNGRIDSMAGSHSKPYISSQPLQSRATSGDGDEAPKETMLFRGKAFKTQFHGPSDAGSSLMHVCVSIYHHRGRMTDRKRYRKYSFTPEMSSQDHLLSCAVEESWVSSESSRKGLTRTSRSLLPKTC